MYIYCVPYSEAKKTDYDEKLFKMQIHHFRIAPVPPEKKQKTHTYTVKAHNVQEELLFLCLSWLWAVLIEVIFSMHQYFYLIIMGDKKLPVSSNIQLSHIK